jgi:LacI family transcriptional regulator
MDTDSTPSGDRRRASTTRGYRRVAVIGLSGGGLDAQVMKGFNVYRRGRQPWTLSDAGHQGEWIERVLGRVHQVNGVLANVTEPAMAERLIEAGVPVVDLSGFVPDVPFARVGFDGLAAGDLAADYFNERAFRRLVFVSPSRRPFEQQRYEGFARTAQRLELPRPMWFQLEQSVWLEPPDDSADPPTLMRWLAQSEQPVGVLSAYDRPGLAICDECRVTGVAVPERVAVLGCDNNTYLCESCEPPLSSIILPGEKVGHEAARLLETLMDGQAPPTEPILLPPVGVFTRESTDVAAIDDRPIAEAVSLMRRQATGSINVSELGRQVHLDRRTFYRRFKKAIGRTPLQELYRLRVEAARQRLVSTNASIYTIAIESGFPDADVFTQRFREHTGMTPSAFRAAHAV